MEVWMLNLCSKCGVMREALEFERVRNKELQDRLLAIVDARAFQAVSFDSKDYKASDYYGGEDDEIEARNEFGEKIVIKKNERPIQN